MIEDQECMTMNILKKGKGELFTDPDPDHARRFFQKKSRKMVNMAMMLSKAIETFVHDGDYLATGGFGGNRTPIAAINGSVNGGGAEMSTCFDFRFMINDQDFTIGHLEILLGIPPGGGGTQRWPRLIGKAKALEIMLKGDLISPEKAERLGMITGSFKKDEFHAKVQTFADTMSKRPPVAVKAIKMAVHQGLETSIRQGLSIELEESVHCYTSLPTSKILERYKDYIKEKIEAPNVKSATIRDTIDMLESEEFLESVSNRSKS